MTTNLPHHSRTTAPAAIDEDPQTTGEMLTGVLTKMGDRLQTESAKTYGPAATELWDDLKAGRFDEQFSDVVAMFNHAAGFDNADAAPGPKAVRTTYQAASPSGATTANDTSPSSVAAAPQAEPAQSSEQDDPTSAIANPDTSDTTPTGATVKLDENRRDTDAPDPKFSEADAARAGSFGAVTTLPGQGSERQERGADMYGLYSIGSGVGGGIDPDAPDGNPDPKAKDEDGDGEDDDKEWFEARAAEIQEQQERQQRWDDEAHSFANMNLTGAQYGRLADDLEDGSPLNRWLLDYIKNKDHRTDEEAKQDVDEIRTALRGMQKNPQDRTPDENKAIEAVNNDPRLQKDMKKAADFDAKSLGSDAKTDATISTATTVAASTDVRSDLLASTGGSSSVWTDTTQATSKAPSLSLSDDGLFASAPDLTAHHQQAVAATEPLDAPKPAQLAVVAPAKPAPAVAPQSGGLEV